MANSPINPEPLPSPSPNLKAPDATPPTQVASPCQLPTQEGQHATPKEYNPPTGKGKVVPE